MQCAIQRVHLPIKHLNTLSFNPFEYPQLDDLLASDRIFLCSCSKHGTHCIFQARLETQCPTLVAGITGMYHHTWLKVPI